MCDLIQVFLIPCLLSWLHHYSFPLFSLRHSAKTMPFCFFNVQDSCIIPQAHFLCICLSAHSPIEISCFLELAFICCLTSGCILFISLQGSCQSIFWKNGTLFAWPTTPYLKERDVICVTHDSHFIPNFTPSLVLACWRRFLREMWIYVSRDRPILQQCVS